jgi:hypothetical protein
MTDKDSAERIALKIPSQREKMKLLNPHAKLIGEIALAWNSLHEQLGYIFWNITGIRNGFVADSIWNSTFSDSAQRTMLRGVVTIVYEEDSKHYKDIICLLDTIDKIAINRNSAVHVALSFTIDASGMTLQPKPFSQSRFAKALDGKDILKEFTLYKQRVYALTTYAASLYAAILSPKHWPWPDRPEMPTRGQKGHRGKTAPRPPRPQVSSRPHAPSQGRRKGA